MVELAAPLPRSMSMSTSMSNPFAGRPTSRSRSASGSGSKPFPPSFSPTTFILSILFIPSAPLGTGL